MSTDQKVANSVSPDNVLGLEFEQYTCSFSPTGKPSAMSLFLLNKEWIAVCISWLTRFQRWTSHALTHPLLPGTSGSRSLRNQNSGFLKTPIMI